MILTDDVVIEKRLDVDWSRKVIWIEAGCFSRNKSLLSILLKQNRIADVDALIADVDPWRAGDKAIHLVPVLSAEGAYLRL